MHEQHCFVCVGLGVGDEHFGVHSTQMGNKVEGIAGPLVSLMAIQLRDSFSMVMLSFQQILIGSSMGIRYLHDFNHPQPVVT